MEGEGLIKHFESFVGNVVKFGKKVFNPNGAYPPNLNDIKTNRGTK